MARRHVLHAMRLALNLKRLVAWEDAVVLDRWRVLIAWSEIAGALLGGVVLVHGHLVTTAPARPPWHAGLAAAFCALSAFAGRELLRGRRRGITLSLGVQALQVAWIWMAHAAFRVTSGPALVLGWTTRGEPEVVLGATAAFRFGDAAPDTSVGAAVNLFAVAALVALVRIRRPVPTTVPDA
jgi:hypothetical protein